ncbi:hypothetical protein PK35_04445 [Tamlana nanhaiensis]|uniref:Uncharacterized protein n=1 Tax=Neotamlana nanhaiensis TaxID=1382798 RepID=A0A0D7W854_9FLAO|nr:hypothetical protein [Tamlana nanhaiensis]KJD33992.1 hypothetical protein PK35_04445 [Tamlana nanhaiensis]
MVDFIRLFYRDKDKFEHFVCQQENFEEVDTIFGLHTGEIKYPYRTSFNGIEVKVTSKHGYVYNSIHKAYNDRFSQEAHNHDDFGYCKLCYMVDYISSKLIDVDKVNLTQFEFGFNIETPVSAQQIIRNNVLMHKQNGANHNRVFNGKGELKQFDYHNFVIKIYDKARQYGLPRNILRFEIRFLKAKEFQKYGIYKITDLKDKQKLRKLFVNLKQRFDEMTIVDSYDESIIPEKDLCKLIRYNNSSYWERVISKKSNQTKMRHIRAYQELLNKYNLLQVKSFLKGLLQKKYLQLINF